MHLKNITHRDVKPENVMVLKGNKYAKKYEELMRYLIKKNKISVIYVVNSLDSRKIFHYVDLYKHCPQKIYIPKKLKSYDLENCS